MAMTGETSARLPRPSGRRVFAKLWANYETRGEVSGRTRTPGVHLHSGKIQSRDGVVNQN